jgi:DNA-binding response OmpR family regulator
MLVLVVEPDDDVRDDLVSYLVVPNFLIETADTEERAIMKAVLVAPDVILLDIDRPRAGAWTILRRLKSSLHTRTVPILCLSRRRDRRTRERIFGAGCDLLIHPFTPEALVAAVRAARRPARLTRPRRPRLRVPLPAR